MIVVKKRKVHAPIVETEIQKYRNDKKQYQTDSLQKCIYESGLNELIPKTAVLLSADETGMRIIPTDSSHTTVRLDYRNIIEIKYIPPIEGEMPLGMFRLNDGDIVLRYQRDHGMIDISLSKPLHGAIYNRHASEKNDLVAFVNARIPEQKEQTVSI